MIRFKNVVVVVCSLALVASVGCSSKKSSASSKQKGGGQKGAAAASAKQQNGGTASSAAATSGTDQGSDYEGATCDDSTEGVAWCDSDTTVILCSSGTWYAVDCSSIGADVCATDLDSQVVDCYSADEVD